MQGQCEAEEETGQRQRSCVRRKSRGEAETKRWRKRCRKNEIQRMGGRRERTSERDRQGREIQKERGGDGENGGEGAEA